MASANAFALLGAGDDAADVDIGALVAAAPTKAVSAPAAPVEEKGESSHHPSQGQRLLRSPAGSPALSIAPQGTPLQHWQPLQPQHSSLRRRR
jgi:hypothetical protein